MACNKLAVFEGKVQIARPAESCEALRTKVAVRDSEAGAGIDQSFFEVEWAGFDLACEGLDASGDYAFSVTSPEAGRDLHLKIQFFCDAACATRLPIGEVWLTIGSPFYVNTDAADSITRYTFAAQAPPSAEATPPAGCVWVDREDGVPTWRCEVDRCRVEGCVNSAGATQFCDPDPSSPDGQIHFCDL